MSGRKGQNSPDRRLARDERRARVARKVHAGLSYRAIAAEEGVAVSTIGDDMEVIRRDWRLQYVKSYDDHREGVLAGLTAVEQTYMPKALDGDVKAAEIVLRYLDRKIRLLGLDAPTRTEVTGADGGPVRVEMTMEAQMARLNSLLAEVEVVEEVEAHAIEAKSRVRDDRKREAS